MDTSCCSFTAGVGPGAGAYEIKICGRPDACGVTAIPTGVGTVSTFVAEDPLAVTVDGPFELEGCDMEILIGVDLEVFSLGGDWDEFTVADIVIGGVVRDGCIT